MRRRFGNHFLKQQEEEEQLQNQHSVGDSTAGRPIFPSNAMFMTYVPVTHLHKTPEREILNEVQSLALL